MIQDQMKNLSHRLRMFGVYANFERRAAEAAGQNLNHLEFLRLVLEDGSAYPIPGRLEFSDVTVDQTTGSVTLRIAFANPHDDLLPGMYVRAILQEGVRQEAILVPQQGITHDATGNATALVLGADQKVELRTLALNRAIGNQWLVDSGLKVGERVIVDGLQGVKPGVQATVGEPAAPSASAPGKIAAVTSGH